MRLATVLGPTAEPVSILGAKVHLRADHDDEDDAIGRMIGSAREYVEGWTKRRLVFQTLRVDLDTFPRCIVLPVGPVRSVTSITYLDSAGDSQTLAASAYQVDLRRERATIIPAPLTAWPTTEVGRMNAVTVNFTAGHAIPFTTDYNSDANLLTATAHPLADGDAGQAFNVGGSLPNGLSELTNYYVVNSVTNGFELSLTSGGSPIALSQDDGAGSNFFGLVPGPILSAMLLMIGHYYENREQEIVGAVTNELKLGLTRLLMPYTLSRFA